MVPSQLQFSCENSALQKSASMNYWLLVSAVFIAALVGPVYQYVWNNQKVLAFLSTTAWQHAVAWLGLLPVLSNLAYTSFDPLEHSIMSLHSLLYARRVSCRQIVEGYLARIEAINPLVNAVITLSNSSLKLADSLDVALQLDPTEAMGRALFCIPVLLKDNFDTSDMPTTGGSLSLKQAQPARDAKVVTRMRNAGAIILGKTNLHEFALEGLSVSSLGGQTHNPYDLTRTPGGSSGGSGAAVAASFSTFATGSDTVNSIRSPAASNALFGIRPTRGLISRAGIMPLSYTQDTIGPLARTVHDLAIALDVMVGTTIYDPEDNMTVAGIGHQPEGSYASSLNGAALRTIRIGVLTTMFDSAASHETESIARAMRSALASLESHGAVIINITNPLFQSDLILAEHDVQKFEFSTILTEYLQKHNYQRNTFEAIYNSHEFLPICYDEVLGAAATTSIGAAQYVQRLEGHTELRQELLREFVRNHLDIMIYPEQRNFVVPIGSQSQRGRNGILAAVLGLPVVVVPAGFSDATATAPLGVPIGMEILGLPFTEAKLLDIAYSFDLATKIRKPPLIAQIPLNYRVMTSVPEIKPNRSVDEVYMTRS